MNNLKGAVWVELERERMLEGDEEGVGALERARCECFIPNIAVYINKAIMFKIFILIN